MAETPQQNSDAGKEKLAYANTRQAAEKLLLNLPSSADDEKNAQWLSDYKTTFSQDYIKNAMKDLEEQGNRARASLPQEYQETAPDMELMELDSTIFSIEKILSQPQFSAFPRDRFIRSRQNENGVTLYEAINYHTNEASKAAFQLLMFTDTLQRYEHVRNYVSETKQEIRRDKRQSRERAEKADKEGVPEYKIAEQQAADLILLSKTQPGITLDQWVEEFNKTFSMKYLTETANTLELASNVTAVWHFQDKNSLLQKKYGVNDYYAGDKTIFETAATGRDDASSRVARLLEFLTALNQSELSEGQE